MEIIIDSVFISIFFPSKIYPFSIFSSWNRCHSNQNSMLYFPIVVSRLFSSCLGIRSHVSVSVRLVRNTPLFSIIYKFCGGVYGGPRSGRTVETTCFEVHVNWKNDMGKMKINKHLIAPILHSNSVKIAENFCTNKNEIIYF